MHVTHLFCASALLVATSAVSAEDSALAETPTVSAADREAWLADYAGLKTSMQQGYANLDWIVAHRGLDLADLDRKTIDRLAAAQSRADAVAAIDTFFAAFRDPHFRPSRGAAPEASLLNAAGVVAHEQSDVQPSAERGPMVVLVDHRSASAAEDFAYWLVGSGVARLVGERTFGAGCGYMDGGWAYQFTAFDAHAMMPNCSRYTADGINQIEGLEPLWRSTGRPGWALLRARSTGLADNPHGGGTRLANSAL